MDEKIKNRALGNIQQKKMQAEAEFQEQMSRLRSVENYEELERERTKLQIELARAEAYDENEKSQNLQEKLKKIDKKCEKIEKKCQFSQKTPNYSCQKCQDTGFADGKMCECLKREISNLLLQESGFSKLESFENSTKTSGDLEQVYKIMQKWCHGWTKNLVFISGPTGTGKTHLLQCIANEMIQQGKLVKLVTAFSMNIKFCECSKSQRGELVKDFLTPEVLFIDDLGAEPMYDNVTEEYLYLVINERKLRNLPTIITSNLTLGDIRERYNERILSRIVDRKTSITISIDGKDRRRG